LKWDDGDAAQNQLIGNSWADPLASVGG